MPVHSASTFRPQAGVASVLAILAALVAATGCSEEPVRPQRAQPELQPAAPPPPPTPMAAVEDAGRWTVARLVTAALAHHPTMASIQAARAAAAAQLRQAASWSNPEIGLSIGRSRPRMEDVAADTPYGGTLSQRLTWWGVREARIAAARAQMDATEAEAQVATLALQAEIRRAAIAYAVAGEAAEQAEAEARIASGLAAMSETRLAAGEADRATCARARLEATTAALQRDTRHREAAAALEALRIWCGPDLPDGLVVADAFGTAPTGDGSGLADASSRHPGLLALSAAVAAAEATAVAERRSRVPDLTVGVFADREDEQDTIGVTLGFELPLWDRNEAAIAAADAEAARLDAAARGERLRLRRDLAEALAAVRSAQREAEALASEALPVAEEAIRLQQAAFAAGEAAMSELLEARRAAIAVRTGLLDARRRAALAMVDVGLAVGDPSIAISTP